MLFKMDFILYLLNKILVDFVLSVILYNVEKLIVNLDVIIC